MDHKERVLSLIEKSLTTHQDHCGRLLSVMEKMSFDPPPPQIDPELMRCAMETNVIADAINQGDAMFFGEQQSLDPNHPAASSASVDEPRYLERQNIIPAIDSQIASLFGERYNPRPKIDASEWPAAFIGYLISAIPSDRWWNVILTHCADATRASWISSFGSHYKVAVAAAVYAAALKSNLIDKQRCDDEIKVLRKSEYGHYWRALPDEDDEG